MNEDHNWRCEVCQASMRWESISTADQERWLGTCLACGHVSAFVLDEDRSTVPDDPLKAFLIGPSQEIRPPSPPWIRVFQISARFPWHVVWRYRAASCPTCGGNVLFETHRVVWLRGPVCCIMCLSCGWTSAERFHSPGLSETPLTGDEWSPPCPAVARLREAVFARPAFDPETTPPFDV
jgi:RNase P subunit RPR2